MNLSKEEFDILGLPSDPWFFSHRDRTKNGSSIQSPEVEELTFSLLPEQDEMHDPEEVIVRKKFRQLSNCFCEDDSLMVEGGGGDTSFTEAGFESFIEQTVSELGPRFYHVELDPTQC